MDYLDEAYETTVSCVKTITNLRQGFCLEVNPVHELSDLNDAPVDCTDLKCASVIALSEKLRCLEGRKYQD